MAEIWQEDDESGPEDEDSSWDDEDDSNATVECSSCGADVYEDAVRCPACGDFMTPASGSFVGRPGWWILVAALLVALLVFTFVIR